MLPRKKIQKVPTTVRTATKRRRRSSSSASNFPLAYLRGIISLKTAGVAVLVILFLVIIVFAVKNKKNIKVQPENNQTSNQNSETVSEPALPSNLEVELYQNKKTVKVEKDSLGQQEIMFYSSASADAILAFYKQWAPAHNFVFASQEESAEKKSGEPEKIAFSLVPVLGADNQVTYNFILEPKENETRMILSYSDSQEKANLQPAEQNQGSPPPSSPSISKDFKIKF